MTGLSLYMDGIVGSGHHHSYPSLEITSYGEGHEHVRKIHNYVT